VPLRSRRGEWDLLGLGVELRPEQVPLLGDSEGLALTLWSLPDPNGLVGRSGRFPPMVDIDHNDRYVPVLWPTIMHYSDVVPYTCMSSEEYMDCQLEEVDLWDLYPIKVGDLAIPVDYLPPTHLTAPVGEDMLSARVVWDLWPVTAEQADEITRAASQGIWGCDYEQMLDVAMALESYEIEPGSQEALILEQGDARPVLNLPPELDRLWRRALRTSQNNWSAITDSTTVPLNTKAAQTRPERMFNPWCLSSL
jgi:hypothetical protein